MLAQNFMSHVDLEISEVEWNALRAVLGMFERKEAPEQLFRMNDIGAPECGTAGCICGWARTIEPTAFTGIWHSGIHDLFIRPSPFLGRSTTTAQAAIALRNYLRTGKPNWADALG